MNNIYYTKGDRRYLRANNVVHHLGVVDATVLDYGKYIQVDRIIYIKREQCSKTLKSQTSSSLL